MRLGREISSEADHRRNEPRLRRCRNVGCSRGFSNELMSISQPGNARSNWSRTTVNSAASPTVSRWMPFTTRIFIVGSNSDQQGTCGGIGRTDTPNCVPDECHRPAMKSKLPIRLTSFSKSDGSGYPASKALGQWAKAQMLGPSASAPSAGALRTNNSLCDVVGTRRRPGLRNYGSADIHGGRARDASARALDLSRNIERLSVRCDGKVSHPRERAAAIAVRGVHSIGDAHATWRRS